MRGVLRETSYLASTIDPHPKLVDPAGQDVLGGMLPESEIVVSPRRKGAEIQGYLAEGKPHLMHLSLREKAIGDSPLIEDLDGACMQPAGAQSDEILGVAALDDGDVDARQRQFSRQH